MATANERLNEKLNELIERFGRMSEKVDSQGKQINRVYDALYGNGKPGLVAEFRELNQNVLQHHDSVKEIQSRSRNDWKWLITTLIAVAAIVVAWLS